MNDGGPGSVVDLRLEPSVTHPAIVDASSVPTERKVAWVREAEPQEATVG